MPSKSPEKKDFSKELRVKFIIFKDSYLRIIFVSNSFVSEGNVTDM